VACLLYLLSSRSRQKIVTWIEVRIPLVSLYKRLAKPGVKFEVGMDPHFPKCLYNLFQSHWTALYVHSLLYVWIISVLLDHALTKKDGFVKTSLTFLLNRYISQYFPVPPFRIRTDFSTITVG